jgi:phospholipid/cholesterol/gamma-HCH transport system permease protein
MSREHAPSRGWPGPLDAVGRGAIGGVAYLGGLATLAVVAARAGIRPSRSCPRLGPAVVRQGGWFLGMGLPLVGLVHVGLGSFLVMQAYFGATFVAAAGPVVGVGLFRNLAPLITGLILAGLLAARLTPELRGRSHVGLDGDPRWIPDREVALGLRPDPRSPTPPARLALARLVAAAGSGPVLSLWGAAVGTGIGWLVARVMLGQSSPVFFGSFLERLWIRDVVGLVAKGAAFGTVAALFACFEGLRTPAVTDPDAVAVASCRAACLSAVTILLINAFWFKIVYLSGTPFGPTVLTPPFP